MCVTRHAPGLLLATPSPRSSPRIAQLPVTLLRASSACQPVLSAESGADCDDLILLAVLRLTLAQLGRQMLTGSRSSALLRPVSVRRVAPITTLRDTGATSIALALAGLVSCFCMNLCHQATVRLLRLKPGRGDLP